jgi:PAP2 superfamily
VIAGASRGGPLVNAVRRDWSGPSLRGARLYPLVFVTVLIYFAITASITESSGASIGSPLWLALGLCTAGLLIRARQLVWVVVVLAIAVFLFFGLDGFSGRALQITHVHPPIDLEQAIFHTSVVVWAQRTYLGMPFHFLLTPVLLAAYMSLWFGPLAACVWIWLKRPESLARFAAAFILLEAIGFLIYFLYPETPPWLASLQGYLPPLHRDVVEALQPFFGLGVSYANSDPAPLSAMPAMHVAVPTLVGWTMFRISRPSKFAILWLLYPVTVGVAVICFAEHYLIDVIVAMTLGTACFAISELIHRRWPKLIESRTA